MCRYISHHLLAQAADWPSFAIRPGPRQCDTIGNLAQRIEHFPRLPKCSMSTPKGASVSAGRPEFMTEHKSIVALVVAAGRGERAGGDGLPKQYRAVAGVFLLARTLRALLAIPTITKVVPVIGPDQGALFAALGLADPRLAAPVIGGETRQVSVFNGLQALADTAPDIVLIHDGARPFVDAALVSRVVTALDDASGALPVTLVTDTIKRSLDGKTVGGT